MMFYQSRTGQCTDLLNHAFSALKIVANSFSAALMSDVVFCGNPGAGKSTLLSCISGVQFKSGQTAWGGMSQRLEFKVSDEFPSCRFADTPGLADPELAEVAAAAITEALRDASVKGRDVKLFFVVPSEAGRITAEHLFTIRKVVQSITLPDDSQPGVNSYGVIVNKCDSISQEHQEQVNKGFALKSHRVPVPTGYTIFLRRVEELSGKDNARYEFPGLKEFVLDFPGFGVKKAAEINVEDLDTQLEQFQRSAAEEFKKLTKMHGEERERFELQAVESAKALKEDLEKKLNEQRLLFEKKTQELHAEIQRRSDWDCESRVSSQARHVFVLRQRMVFTQQVIQT